MKTTLLIGLVLATITPGAPTQTHTHGTMVGSLRPDSAIVWTRASATAKVSALFNFSPNVANATETAAVLVTAGNDFTAHIKITGLSAGRKYYYTTRVANPSNPTINTIGAWGSFTTPPTNASKSKLTFIVSGDVFDLTQYGMFNQVAKHPANFYLNLGDMPYADGSINQAEYWKHHRDARNHPYWFALIQRMAVEAMWDDHEVVDDWDKATPANLVAWGKKAFFDYWPLPQGTSTMYRTIRWGAGAEIWLLDCRAHRDANAKVSTPAKTMLGAKQKAWLKRTLSASDATFKIICSSVPIRFGKNSGDDWAGFISERHEILDFIVKNSIQNVVFLSADSHVISVHNFREGLREYQSGPLATIVRPQVPAGPEVRFRASILNFLVVHVDPTVTPAKLTLEYYDANNRKVFADELLSLRPATAKFFTDLPAGGFQFAGPHYFHERGNVSLPRIDPGSYQLRFTPEPGILHVPSDIQVTVPPGSQVAVGAHWRVLPGSAGLFADTFDKPLSGYTVIDETGTGGPSAWLVSGGVLVQGSGIGGPVGSVDNDRPGTLLITGSQTWVDYTTTVRLKSHERGRCGVLFRYRDKDNYYRFLMDEKRPLMRLEKKVNGVYTTLAERLVPYVRHNYYDVRCVANGTSIEVYVDDEPFFSVTDSSLTAGQVGLYTWQNLLTVFEDLTVTESDDYQAPVNRVFTDFFEDGALRGWTIIDHARQSGASSWLETIGVPMQLSNIGDLDVTNPIAKRGTVCLADATVPDDMQFAASMLSYDDDAMGLVFRYTDADNHYRFSWNRALRERQLQKVHQGVWSVLWSDSNDFNPLQWYRVRIEAVGPRLRLFVGEELLADVTDLTHKSGSAGLYCWRNAPVLFDRVLIQKPHLRLPTLVAVTDGFVTKLHGRSEADAGFAYGVALSFARSPAIPLRWLTLGDPRYLELAPDFLFQASIRPSSLFSNFFGTLNNRGEFTATIQWPRLSALKGTTIFAAGWTGDITRSPIQNVMPTLEIIYP